MPNINSLQQAPAGEFLDKAEMRQLTGRAQVNAQARWLEENQVPHRRDGSRLIVSRQHVRQWIEGTHRAGGNETTWDAPHVEPDLSNVR